MKAGPDRRYTPEFREAAVRQVIDGGRSMSAVARSLEMSVKTLANWVYRARKGQALPGRAAAHAVSDEQAELSRLRQENARLKMERDILKKSGRVLCQGVDVRYAWIEQHRRRWPAALMCRLLGVSRSGLYASRARGPSQRAQDDELLVEQIRQAQHKHRGRYGRRRMTTEVSDMHGSAVNHKRVGRLMREHSLQSSKRRRHRVCTTDSRHAHPVAPNVLQRNFRSTAPNRKWLADITYVPTDEGWLYLALVLDLYARKKSWLGHERGDAPAADAQRAGCGAGLARPRCRAGAPLGPQLAVCGRRLPGQAASTGHHGVDEPQGRLLGQRTDGVMQWHREGRMRQ